MGREAHADNTPAGDAALGGVRPVDAAHAWAEHRRWVAAVLLAHKPANAELEDLLQEVAYKLVEHASSVRDAGSLRPWLRTVAVNTAREAGRRQTRRARLAPRSRLDPDLVPGRASEPSGGGSEPGRANASELAALVAQLPEGYREPLMLRAVRGLGNRQVAELMGLPESTVETRVCRARRMLRELARANNPSSVETAR